jgi:hypothetical protein
VEKIEKIFGEVLERWAFLFNEAEERDDLKESPPGGVSGIRIAFSGAGSGFLELALPATLGPVIAANVLGLDPEDEQAAGASDDALREMANVLCGHFLTAQAGEGPLFDLEPPACFSGEEGAKFWMALAGDEKTSACRIEDEPVLWRWTYQDAEGSTR